MHLLCTLHGLPGGFALTGAKPTNARPCSGSSTPIRSCPPGVGQIVIADRNYYGHGFESELADAGLDLLRPARKGESERPGARFFKPSRQGHRVDQRHPRGRLDPEQHGDHTPAGVWVRVVQRVLAMTAAIWHNDRTAQPIKRSLVAYDH